MRPLLDGAAARARENAGRHVDARPVGNQGDGGEAALSTEEYCSRSSTLLLEARITACAWQEVRRAKSASPANRPDSRTAIAVRRGEASTFRSRSASAQWRVGAGETSQLRDFTSRLGGTEGWNYATARCPAYANLVKGIGSAHDGRVTESKRDGTDYRCDGDDRHEGPNGIGEFSLTDRARLCGSRLIGANGVSTENGRAATSATRTSPWGAIPGRLTQALERGSGRALGSVGLQRLRQVNTAIVSTTIASSQPRVASEGERVN